ncbi:MAG: type II toxin-antitoxin system PemK/MazF family toxin [Dysgonamonadaceae bacterium]|jgi:mRNA interferase MazF|nr:type II toxin-antitoxin system PemK/MazF family toxin [Dysgonamonadaceae bacterium]
MDPIQFGSIVLMKFPYTDGISHKRRPALVIKNFQDGDVLVCRITSKIYESQYDIYLDHWLKYGLKLPSVIRIHKMATLERNRIEAVMGQVDDTVQSMIKSAYQSIV